MNLPAPRKVLTAFQMAEVDRATIELGIPGIILMENAAARVVEFLAQRFAPLRDQRILVVCGKGNNGGDGLAIARQLHVHIQPRALRVVLAADPAELTGDAAANLKMLRATGVEEYRDFGILMRDSTLIVDAVLGTGLKGPAKGPALDAIREINAGFAFAKVVAVDIPSGLSGDSAAPEGEYVRADATVTFTAPKLCHALAPACDLMGELRVASIGSPVSLYETNERIQLALVTPESIAPLFAPRPRNSNKGSFGHVLVVAGSRGKSGAAAMSGLAALRSGAGLVTVACPESALAAVAAHAPELMTEPLPETASGTLARSAFDRIMELASKRSVLAIGPGIGTDDETRDVVVRVFDTLAKPAVFDADALNCLVGHDAPATALRILTPHPGEMSRLANCTIPEIQADRVSAARQFATERNVVLVLKGERTLLGMEDGCIWINPTGSPALATGGTGDILTGMISGLVAQVADHPRRAAAAAVYLHGLAGEIAARQLTEQCVIATDLLRFLPEAIRGIQNLSHSD
jgi:NAD(P)H-hydrate epimerase